MLSYLTAGESHGKGIITTIQGLPAGLTIDSRLIKQALRRRRHTPGRSYRMRLEDDQFEILSGVRHGKTIGAPLTVLIYNRVTLIDQIEPLIFPRPGHIDLAGAVKFGLKDARDITERASARETVGRVVAGTIAQMFLSNFQITVLGYVLQIADIIAPPLPQTTKTPSYLLSQRNRSSFYLLNHLVEDQIRQKVNQAEKDGDTLGGIFEVRGFNLPIGLGSHAQWQDRLDSRLAGAIMAIPAVKAVEIGLGRGYADLSGSIVHDVINPDFRRQSNNAGGLEGGLTNGEDIIVRAVVKPVPTLRKPLPSVNLVTGKPTLAKVERSDICVVPAASVVGEAVVAFELARAFLEKFSGDSLNEVKRNFLAYQETFRKNYPYNRKFFNN